MKTGTVLNRMKSTTAPPETRPKPPDEGNTLLQPLQQIIDAEDYARGTAKRTKLVVAQLGNDAGIIGAAFAFRYQ